MMFKQLSFAGIIPDQHFLHPFNWKANALLKHHLENLDSNSEEKFIYIWGQAGFGKTHALQTITTDLSKHKTSIYLPLQHAEQFTPQCLENLERQNIVTLDDIHQIKQQKHWEEAIFHLYNRIRDSKDTLLIITGDKPPAHLGIELADLVSRLQWGFCWQLKEPEDEEKILILSKSALLKGFELPISVAQYLLSHYDRNLSSLMRLLDDLNILSFEAQRRVVSIPFLKKCLNRSNTF
jgi:DnaA family protein